MSKRGFTNERTGTGGFVDRVVDNALSSTAGILSTKPTAKYASGARTILKINNKIVGFAFSVQWRITTDYMENRTIDDYLPAELIPFRVSVDGSIGTFHLPGQSASANLIQADVLSFLFHKYITIEVRDSATDQLLFYTNKAVITSRTESLQSEQLGTVQLSFKAIGWKDEREPEMPVGADSIDAAGASEASAGSRLVQAGTDAFNKVKGVFSK